MRLSLLLLLTAAGSFNVGGFPEGFFSKLTNFFHRTATAPPSEAPNTYQRYHSPDEDLFGVIPPGDICVSDLDCAGYPAASCNDGVCHCSEGALNAGPTCVRSAAESNRTAPCQIGQIYVEEAGACMTVQYPGQPCQYSEQCSGTEQGAFCSRLRCQCAYGMTISGTSCVFSNQNCTQRDHVWIDELGECKRVILPGLTGCSHSSQCLTAYMGTYCFHQKCTCPAPLYPVNGTCGQQCLQGYAYSSVAGECLPNVLPGEKCLYSSQCSAMQAGTLCRRGRCRCAGGLVFSTSECVKACPNGFVVNRFGLCRRECTHNQVEYNGDCYGKVDAGQKCDPSVRCSGYSTCVDGLCTCPANMVIKSGTCHPGTLQPLDLCAGAEECIGGSYCSNGKCICPPGTKVLNGQCVTPVTVPPKSSCNQSVQCGGGSNCIDAVCQCPSSQVPIGENCQHPLLVPAGGPCPVGFEKCLGGSSCIDGICNCPVGAVAELGECIAVKTVSAGSSCSPSRLCTGFSTCIRGVCRCSKGMNIYNGECRPSQESGVGSTCANGEKCTGGSVCSNSVCKCPSSMININGVCQKRKRSRPGEGCNIGTKCVGGSKCVGRVCMCPSNTVAFQGKCFPVLGFSAKCTDSSQCGGGSYCHPKHQVCLCPVKQLLVGQKCVATASLPRSSFPYLKPCSRSVDCGTGAKCIMKRGCRCECPTGSIYQNGQCWMVMMRAGDSCRRGETCTGGSTCNNGTCGCSPQETIVNGRCMLKTKPTAYVGSRENCLFANVKCDEGSICMNDICTCTMGTVLHGGRCRTHVIAELGESCARGEHCEGRSVCSRSTWKCVCPLKMIKIGKKCQPRLKSAPGFPCGKGEICIGGSYCQDETCVCAPSHVRQGRQCVARKRALPGDPCDRGEECRGGSSCIGGTCVCPSHLVIYEKECREQPISKLGMICGRGEKCIDGSFCDSNRRICVCPSGLSAKQGTCQQSTDGTAMTVDIQAASVTWYSLSNQSPSTNPATLGPDVSTTRLLTTRRMKEASTRANLLLRKSDQWSISGLASILGQTSTWSRTNTSSQQSLLSQISISRQTSTSSQMRSTSPTQQRPQHTTSSARPYQPDRCRFDGDCSGGAQCARGYCLCPVHQVMKDGYCLNVTTEVPTPKTGKVYRPCVASNQCADGAECVSGVCRCPQGTIDSRYGFCIPPKAERKKRKAAVKGRFDITGVDIVALGEACDSEMGQLCADGTLCIDGFCRCEEGSIQYGSTCIQKEYAKRGRNCTDGKRCSEDLVCENRICVKQKRSASASTKHCAIDATICEGGTYCLKNKCVCPLGTNLIRGSCSSPTSNYAPYDEASAPANFGLEMISSRSSSARSTNSAHDPGFLMAGNMNRVHGEAISKFSANMSPTHGSLRISSFPLDVTGNAVPADRFSAGNGDIDPTFGLTLWSNFNNILTIDNTAGVPTAGNNPIVSPGSPCIQEGVMLQCAGNSICANGFCTCPFGEQIINGICVGRDSRAAPGETCQFEITRCTGGSLCVSGICTCPANQASFNGQCTTVMKAKAQALPNHPCTSALLCAGKSTCVSGFCRCPRGMFAAAGASVCTRFPTNFLTQLWAAPGQRCGTNALANTCSGGAMCINGVCICPAGQVLSKNKCVPYIGEAPAGGSCATPGTVCGGGSTCLNGLCECAVGSIPQNGLCVPSNIFQPTPILEPGEVCTSQCAVCAQCGGGSVCMNNICTCPIGYFAFRSRCVPFQLSPMPAGFPHPAISPHPPLDASTSASIVLVGPGEACNVTAICNGGSSCIIGRCVCPPGYMPNPGRNSCLNALLEQLPRVMAAHPGQRCSVSGGCDGGANCVDGTCTCPMNSYPSNNVCMQHQQAPPILYPGSSCTSKDQCQLNSRCFNGYCVCLGDLDTNASGFCTNASSPSIRKGMAGSHCSASSSCASDFLKCSAWGYCVCIEGFIGNGLGECSSTIRSALAVTTLKSGFGMRCLKSSDCKAKLICNEQRCRCPQGTYESNDKCVHSPTSVPTGSWCDESKGVMCSGGSSCHQNSCVCPYGHLIIGVECVPAPHVLPGGSCMNGELCVGGSQCIMGKCICLSGLTVNGKTCQVHSARSKRSLPGQYAASKSPYDGVTRYQKRNDIQQCPSNGSCQLPDCFCSRTGMEIPGGYEAADVPQMVILTFDDPVTDRSIRIFKSLFNGRFRNPNGCPIKATFFISHEWNNYDQTQWLMSNGHEIGIGSMTGDPLEGASSERWRAELVGMRDALQLFSYVPRDEIIGVRAPHFETGGDKQFSMMKSSGFTYDSTMSFSDGPYWPQTFDFKLAWGCSKRGCPSASYTGLWEIPISQLTRRDSPDHFIKLTDAVKDDDLPADISDVLEENFQRHYRSNRAPFVVAMDTDYLISLPNNGAVRALEIFISKVLENLDVYVVTASQALRWLKLPTRLSKVHYFPAWQCPLQTKNHVLPCENPSTCVFTRDRGEAHAFRVCGSCPRAYPKLGDPRGSGNVIVVK